MSIDFSRLLPLGWSNFFSTQIPLEALDRARPARVVRMERDRYGVDAGAGEFFATLAGRFRHEHEGEALPTAGDWVLLATGDPVIVQCLERRTLIARRAAGGVARQAVAANIDLMVVVGGLDAEFNVHRIEHYLVMAAPQNRGQITVFSNVYRGKDADCFSFRVVVVIIVLASLDYRWEHQRKENPR